MNENVNCQNLFSSLGMGSPPIVIYPYLLLLIMVLPSWSQNVSTAALLRDFDNVLNHHAATDANAFNDDEMYKGHLNQAS